MEKRKIKTVEAISIGKTPYKNDDGIYSGENFIAVIDGVSSKSTVIVDGKKIKIASLIIEAIKKMDSEKAPSYAKELNFAEFTKFVNMYIKKYCEKVGHNLKENPLEATGVIYSKFNNEIWLVGDCRACYDGRELTNDLKIDDISTQIRKEILNSLLKNGYTVKQLFENDLSRDIIKNPERIYDYIDDEKEIKRLTLYIETLMHQALIECGFSEKDIKEKDLLNRFNTPKKLQNYVKNNANVFSYGYSVFNGIYTETKNCRIVRVPDSTKQIRFSSDGISIELLRKSKDLGQIVRKNRKLAKSDPLSIDKNIGIAGAAKQSKREDYLSIDDSSAIFFEIDGGDNQER